MTLPATFQSLPTTQRMKSKVLDPEATVSASGLTCCYTLWPMKLQQHWQSLGCACA